MINGKKRMIQKNLLKLEALQNKIENNWKENDYVVTL